MRSRVTYDTFIYYSPGSRNWTPESRSSRPHLRRLRIYPHHQRRLITVRGSGITVTSDRTQDRARAITRNLPRRRRVTCACKRIIETIRLAEVRIRVPTRERFTLLFTTRSIVSIAASAEFIALTLISLFHSARIIILGISRDTSKSRHMDVELRDGLKFRDRECESTALSASPAEHHRPRSAPNFTVQSRNLSEKKHLS